VPDARSNGTVPEIATTPLAEVTANHKQIDPALFELAGVLAK
jgi:hypothetical protein